MGRDEGHEAPTRHGLEHQEGVVEFTHGRRVKAVFPEKVVDLPIVDGCRAALEQRQIPPVGSRLDIGSRHGHEHGTVDEHDLQARPRGLDRLAFPDDEIDFMRAQIAKQVCDPSGANRRTASLHGEHRHQKVGREGARRCRADSDAQGDGAPRTVAREAIKATW